MMRCPGENFFPYVMLVAALCLTAADASAHSGRHEKDIFTKHFQRSLFAISQKGQVSVEVLLDEKEHKIGRDMIGIVVHDSHDEDVEDAKLTLTVAGAPEPLKVIEKGDGLYVAPSENLPKEGKWELTIEVKKKKISDSVIFSFPEAAEKLLPAGKYGTDILKGRK